MYAKTISSLDDYPSLEKFLLTFPNISRAFIKRTIPKQLRKKAITAHSEIALPEGFLNYGLINCYNGENLNILFEDHDFLVVDKFPNIHCHPLDYQEQSSVINWIRSYNASLLSVNSQNYDRGLLYRLDFATSGGLVYVKDEQLLMRLREKINVSIVKHYWAIVTGDIVEQQVLEDYLLPLGAKGAKMQVDSRGQLAKLSLKKLYYDSVKNISLVQIRLFTGMRHQIRCQLANFGYPLLGDTLYGGEVADRLYLHAYQYLLGEKQLFVSKPQYGELFHYFLRLYC